MRHMPATATDAVHGSMHTCAQHPRATQLPGSSTDAKDTCLECRASPGRAVEWGHAPIRDMPNAVQARATTCMLSARSMPSVVLPMPELSVVFAGAGKLVHGVEPFRQ